MHNLNLDPIFPNNYMFALACMPLSLCLAAHRYHLCTSRSHVTQLRRHMSAQIIHPRCIEAQYLPASKRCSMLGELLQPEGDCYLTELMLCAVRSWLMDRS